VQRLDHVAELIDGRKRVATRAVRVMRREERHRLVAPVVGQARRGVLRIELEDREQLDRRDAEVGQVGDFLDQTRVGTRFSGVTPELGCRVKPRTFSSWMIVSAKGRPNGRDGAAGLAAHRAIVGARHGDRAPTRIEEQFVGVEPDAPVRRIPPCRPVAIDRPDPMPGTNACQ
jgi:hypothetical protein